MSDASEIKVVDRRTFGAEPGDEADPAQPEASEEAFIASETGDTPTYVQQLEERTARAEAQLARYVEAHKTELQRAVSKAQLRLQREADRELARMRGELVGGLLEVLDNFDRSLEALPTNADASMRQGLQLVRDQFFGSLARFGLARVEAEGARFDPQVHEAIATTNVDDPDLDGTVTAVLKQGYLLGEQLIRPALVQVARHAP